MPATSLEDLVERQVRRWEAERRVYTPPPRQPCVALSRLPGAGAAEVGRRAAALLDYGFFGIEIVDRIARELGVQHRLVAGLDERVRTVIERYVADAFQSRPFTETDYQRALVRTIATLGERGRAVILGRGAPYVLSPSRALRVFVVAPREARVARVAREEGLSAAEADERLAQRDAERLRFLRHDFGVEPDDPTLYDLVVNTETLGIETSAALVIDALTRRFAAPHATAAARAQDARGPDE
jgi:cytidylate kinase